jgi:hypothetical protein
MRRASITSLFLLLAAAAPSTERRVALTSVDRLLVIGPVAVTVSAGPAPALRTSDAGVSFDIQSGTLKLRSDARAADAPAVAVALTVPGLRSITVDGGGSVSVDRARGDRLVLLANGPGAIGVALVEEDDLEATAVGDGRITLAGKAARARLTTAGDAHIDAAGLTADELVLRMDGGEAAVRARYAATVTAVGKAKATIAGNASCTVRAPAGAQISCGPAKPVR